MSCGGSIDINSPRTCRELNIVDDREDRSADEAVGRAASRESGRLSRSRTASRDTGRRLSRTFSRDMSRLSSAAQIASVQTWLSQKARRAVVALPESCELKAVDEECECLLQQERELLAELEAIAGSYASEATSKREMLYHKWSSRVFAALHSRIAVTMGGNRYCSLDKEKRELFQNYLNYCNKQRVFLETMSYGDYNPLGLRHHHTQLTAVTGSLDDPLLTQQSDRAREQHIITGSHGDRSVDTERGLDAVSWLAIQLVHVDSREREIAQHRVQRDHNEMQEGGGELRLPHKTPLSLSPSSSQFPLTWPDS